MLRTSLFVLALLLTAGHAYAEIKLEIGPDTTVIDGPINPDGTINYLAYLNAKLSEGVTPENNFAVDVASVMGEGRWLSEAYWDKVFKGLGIEKPVKGQFLSTIKKAIGEGEVVASDDPRYQSWIKVISGPWTAEDHPDVNQWLDDQSEVLDSIKRASYKDQFYFPLVVDDNEPEVVDMTLRPWLGTLRKAGIGLQARAERHIASGNLDDALSDVFAIRRIANQSMKDPLAFSWIVGFSIDRMALTVIEDIASSEHLTGELAKQMIIDVLRHGRIQRYGDDNISFVRFAALDMVMHCWQGRGDLIPEPFEGPGDMTIPRIFDPFIESAQYDPNVTLRAINDWAERWRRAGQIGDYHERLAATERLGRVSELKYDQALRLLKGDPDASRLMRQKVLASNKETAAVTSVTVAYAYLAHGSIYQAQAKIKMRLALAPVALAIGGYHAEHGEYPPDLHALVPAYLEELPLDFATGALPVYRVEDGAAIVYSLGIDLEDDGGVDDSNEGDIVFLIER